MEICCSPKYHPEIAGESIEFCWAFSKNNYRRCKIEDKKTKAKFIKLVDECQKGISKQSVRVFGRRMRRYILAYFSLAKTKEDQIYTDGPIHTNDGNIIHLPEMSLHLVERMVKPKRCHRNIADQEKKFINFIMPLMKEISRNLS